MQFYYVSYRKDVIDWCHGCAEYVVNKGPRTRAMKWYNIEAPFDTIATDVSGLFPKSRSGNHYILVDRYYFSKWTEAYTLPNQEKSKVAKTLIENMFS